MQGLIYMPTLASVALLLYKGGFYGSAHVQAMTLGYILKTNRDKLNCISEIYIHSLRILVFPKSFLVRSFTILCPILISAISPLPQHLIIEKEDILSHHFKSE